jgi:hypothetical protein
VILKECISLFCGIRKNALFVNNFWHISLAMPMHDSFCDYYWHFFHFYFSVIKKITRKDLKK